MPLTVAVQNHYAECIELLLEHCPEQQLASVSKEGFTALMLAAQDGHVGCARVSLVLHGSSDRHPQHDAGGLLTCVRWSKTAMLTAAVQPRQMCQGEAHLVLCMCVLPAVEECFKVMIAGCTGRPC